MEIAAREFGANHHRAEEAWSHWVASFLRDHYGAAHQARTLERYLTGWRNLTCFLEERDIRFPRLLRREDLFDYLRWRQQTRNERVRPCSFNTARHEIKLLGLILQEAVHRGYCTSNPSRVMGLSRQPTKPKPDISRTDIELIRQQLIHEPEWMRVCFEIAIHHGTRLRATKVHLERDIDWTAGTITFHEKGSKLLTVPMAEDLHLLLQGLRLQGREFSCMLPRDASRHWRRFFDSIDRPQYCFHCSRVTVVTNLARAGVSESLAMRFVGHASTEIHRIYQRLGVRDLDRCHLAMSAVLDSPSNTRTHIMRSSTPSLV
ncbi:MAG: tyrosine-type recombinase/integrase [Limisphaerales bacterium]